MGTENIGGIDVVIQAHDAQYNAAMRRAQATAGATAQQIASAFRNANMGVGFNKLASDADRMFTGFGNRFRLLGRDLRSFQFAMAGSLGAIGGYMSGRAFISAAGGFEQQMNIMAAVSGEAASGMSQAREQALALGAATARSANDIAGAQLELTKMGFSMQRVLELTPSVTNLSIAADMPMQQAAHTAGAIMRQFGLQASEMENVMDVIVRGANQSAAEVSDFAGSLRYAGSMARAANIDLETTVAILESASNAGMEGFMAGTSFRSLVGDFNTPTPIASQFFRQFKIQLRDSDGQLRDIIDLMEEVATKVPRNLLGPPFLETDSANLFNALFPASQSAADSATVLRARDVDKRVNQTGEAARIAEARMKGLTGAIEALKGAFETLMVRIGDSGFLGQATNFARTMGQWVSAISQADAAMLGLVGAIGLLVIALGPLLFALGSLLTILTSGLGMAIAAVAAVALAGVLRELESVTRGVKEAMDDTAESFDKSAQSLRGFASATRDVKAAMLAQNAVEIQPLFAHAIAKEMEARRLERMDPRHPSYAGEDQGFRAVGDAVIGAFPGVETAHDRARQARVAADTAQDRLEQALAARAAAEEDYRESAPEVIAQREGERRAAFEARNVARAAAGSRFDERAWLEANPQHAAAMARPVPRNDQPFTPATPGTRFTGFTPLQGIQRETTMLEDLVPFAWQGQRTIDALEEARAIREQSMSPMAGPNNEPRYDLTEEQAQAEQIKRERARQALARGASNEEAERTIADQQRLAEAAADGERAYERMRIQLELLNPVYGRTQEEAAALAEQIEESAHQATRAQERMSAWAQTMRDVGQTIAGAFESAITQGGKLIDVLRNMAKEIVLLVLRATVIKPMADWIGNMLNGGGAKQKKGGGGDIVSALASAFSGGGGGGSWADAVSSFLGGRAHGGPVWAGGAYRVGEQGPELFVPNASGRIVSAAQMAGGGGGGAATIVYSPSYQFTGTAEEIAAVKRMVANDRQRFASQVRGVVGDLKHRGRMG